MLSNDRPVRAGQMLQMLAGHYLNSVELYRAQPTPQHEDDMRTHAILCRSYAQEIEKLVAKEIADAADREIARDRANDELDDSEVSVLCA